MMTLKRRRREIFFKIYIRSFGVIAVLAVRACDTDAVLDGRFAHQYSPRMRAFLFANCRAKTTLPC